MTESFWSSSFNYGIFFLKCSNEHHTHNSTYGQRDSYKCVMIVPVLFLIPVLIIPNTVPQFFSQCCKQNHIMETFKLSSVFSVSKIAAGIITLFYSVKFCIYCFFINVPLLVSVQCFALCPMSKICQKCTNGKEELGS